MIELGQVSTRPMVAFLLLRHPLGWCTWQNPRELWTQLGLRLPKKALLQLYNSRLKFHSSYQPFRPSSFLWFNPSPHHPTDRNTFHSLLLVHKIVSLPRIWEEARQANVPTKLAWLMHFPPSSCSALPRAKCSDRPSKEGVWEDPGALEKTKLPVCRNETCSRQFLPLPWGWEWDLRRGDHLLGVRYLLFHLSHLTNCGSFLTFLIQRDHEVRLPPSVF